MLILTIAQLHITLKFHFILYIYVYFGYIRACNLVFVFVCVTPVKVIVDVCTDGVKLN